MHIETGMDSILVCVRCKTGIARRLDIFSVPGAEGNVGAYVNPHGTVELLP